jgi:tRNA pseudouridine38-40 synthase
VTTFRLTIEYDGTRFSGWQAQPQQPHVRTIQGVLEEALETMLREKIRIQGAGRTDAGVHALGQVASFDTKTDLSPRRLAHGLTALSRPNIAVINVAIAPDGFNARFDSIGKHYCYRVLSRSVPSPLHARTSFFVPAELDIIQMLKAAKRLEGRHDFAGFRSADCGRENTIREISEIMIERNDHGMITFNIKGSGFLKNMVRIIVGTLIDVGRKRFNPDDVTQILATGDRTLAGQTVPANGLTLVKSFYPKDWIRQRP